jgi:non-heme chloroperoxidase
VPYMTANDGVQLFYREAGTGPPIVIIPGLCQTTSVFVHQLAGLAAHHRVIAYDQRGHGESGKPAHGYRVARLAKDLDDLLGALGLTGVTLLGWSLGCSVAWCYYDLFGPGRLSRLVLVDGTVFMCRTPDMTETAAAQVGAAYDAAGIAGLARQVREQEEDVLRLFASGFVTDGQGEVDRLVGDMLKTPAPAAAALLFDYAFGDWRDVVARIALPTMIVGADHSHIPLSVQQWLHDTIPDSRLAIMKDRAHLMFYEEPDAFNDLVARFVAETGPGSR